MITALDFILNIILLLFVKKPVNTEQKMKFSIKGFFSKCDQIHRKLRIWSYLLKKSLMEKFIFCAVQKLHALARIAHYMDFEKRRSLMKAFVISQFNYCPLISMFHNRALNNRINRKHERALRLVYQNNN